MSTRTVEQSFGAVARVEAGAPETFVTVSTSNPALDLIPVFNSIFELTSEMALRHDGTDPNAPSDGLDFKPKHLHAVAVMRFIQAMVDSARARDVTNPAFHKYLNASLEILNEQRNEHGFRPKAPATISLPAQVARTMFICSQTGMEEQGLCNSVKKLFDTEGKKFYVKNAEGSIRVVPMLTCLHVTCPANLDPSEFEMTALQEFSAAFNTVNTAHTLGVTNAQPFAKNGRSLRSLVIAGSVTCILVTGITADDARAGNARHFIKMMATLAKSTGVAILFICSTGAFAELTKRHADIKWLTQLGVYEVQRESANSEYWRQCCLTAWERYLARPYGAEMPGWFSQRMWEATCGLDELRTTVCTVMAARVPTKKGLTLTEAAFRKQSKVALLADAPYLRALRALESNSCSPSAARRHADFLPLAWNIQATIAEDEFADVITPPESEGEDEAAGSSNRGTNPKEVDA
ncbi:hypothetical protein [Caballeronia sp. ATUFL_M2_KS44]|uniref:hypothetical protein n=1 Tax=Caballeronia sp. ATUFL_M2_KS44 TaxID=2921767 RepID=UPI002028EDBC|nr:hypothetical protein [Caballeronia sp. ATUFL_M2_KS44]